MITGWWCDNHLEKYEFVNGKDDMEWKKNVWNHQPVFKSWCELYFTKLMSFHPFSLLVVTTTEMIVLASFCREWQLLQQMCGIQIPTPTMQCMHYLILQSSEILPATKTMSPYKHSCRTCMRQKYANRMMNSCIFVCQSCLLEGRIQGFGCEVQSVAGEIPVSPIKSQCLLLK